MKNARSKKTEPVSVSWEKLLTSHGFQRQLTATSGYLSGESRSVDRSNEIATFNAK